MQGDRREPTMTLRDCELVRITYQFNLQISIRINGVIDLINPNKWRNVA